MVKLKCVYIYSTSSGIRVYKLDYIASRNLYIAIFENKGRKSRVKCRYILWRFTIDQNNETSGAQESARNVECYSEKDCEHSFH